MNRNLNPVRRHAWRTREVLCFDGSRMPCRCSNLHRIWRLVTFR